MCRILDQSPFTSRPPDFSKKTRLLKALLPSMMLSHSTHSGITQWHHWMDLALLVLPSLGN